MDLLLFLYFIHTPLQQTEAAVEPVKYEVSREATVELTPIGNGRATFEIGRFTRGSRLDLLLKLNNPYDAPVRLGRQFAGCACLDVKISADEIEPHSSGEISLSLEVPKDSKDIENVVMLNIGQTKEQLDAGVGITILIKYSISELFAFTDKQRVVTVPEQEKTVSFILPLVCSEQEKLKDYKIFAPDNLGEFTYSIESRDGQPVALCKLDVAEMQLDSDSGEVALSVGDRPVDTLLLTVSRVKDVSLHPDPLRFSWDSVNKCFKSEALVRIRPEKSDSAVVIRQPRFTATAKGARVETTLEELAGGICRVKFSVFPEIELEQFQIEVKTDGMYWVLRNNGKRVGGTNRLYFVR